MTTRVNDLHAITIVTPTIAPRSALLEQAGHTVHAQVLPAFEWRVVRDEDHVGAAVTRHTGLMEVRTPWVAFLDDDDLLMPLHLERLYAHAMDTGADYVYSWFETLPPGGDPFPPGHFLDPWDPAAPRQTTVTTMVRTELAQEVGFLWTDDGAEVAGQRAGEDWRFTLECNRLGKISHLVERTWYWRHHGYGTPGVSGNTSGMGSRW